MPPTLTAEQLEIQHDQAVQRDWDTPDPVGYLVGVVLLGALLVWTLTEVWEWWQRRR